jgi:hypothetical protein
MATWSVSPTSTSRHWPITAGQPKPLLSCPAAPPSALGWYAVTATGAAPVTFSLTNTAASISGVAVRWGASGSAPLNLPATPGGLILPTGRTTDVPWLGIDQITLTLSTAAILTPANITISSAIGANYGPVTVTNSGTTVTISLNTPIETADRVTIGISGPGITSLSGQLAVLPGDFNDDGVVNVQDLVAVERQWLGVVTPTMFGDITGDGKPTEADYLAVRQRIGTRLPPGP